MAGRDQLRPMQRLMRIMAVLDQAGSGGASRDRLLKVAEYGDADPGSQLALDLKHLRDQGWWIDNVAAVGEQARYRMVSGDNRLRVRLTPRQWAALQRAVMVADRDDLARLLNVGPESLPDAVGIQVAPRQTSHDLSLALQALQLASRIRFSYKGTRRVLDPGSVRFQNQHWYLSGVEEGDTQVKHFAIDRMSDTSLDKPGTAKKVPEVREIPLHPLQWRIDEPTDVVIRAVADFVPDVQRWLGVPNLAISRAGAVDMTYTVTNRAAFRARIYVLGQRVSVVGPASFRAELLTELRELAGR